MRFCTALVMLCTLSLPSAVCAYEASPPQATPILAQHAHILPTLGVTTMAVAQEKQAAAIGADIVKRGGNAIDGAVAMGFALAVTLPRAGNLGGGGFLIAWLAKEQRAVALDFRERAPNAARPTMFLDSSGAPDPKASREGGRAIGAPGSVAGLVYAHKHWGSGKFTLAQLMAPAIILAREGVIVDGDLADSLPQAAARLAPYESSRKIFFADGAPLKPGAKLVQTDLAATLERIAEKGEAGFYQGETARKLATYVQSIGGLITEGDLQEYKPVERKILTGRYRGREILSMPPPSSGGVHLIELLNIAEHFPLAQNGSGSAANIHILAEAMKYAFADRAQWLGDPDFVKAPIAGLISKPYASEVASKIAMDRARPADEISAIDPTPYEGDQTTHYSIVDDQGDAVAVTTTLNFSYGAGMVAEGLGFLLNNEMDDFSAKVGAANAFGLVGGAQNLPEPGKRPLSSMTPTIVLKDGAVEIVTGTPGGPRIITTVLENVINVIDYGMNAAEAMSAPRFHHQWRPDALRVENGFSPDTLAILRAKGHKIVEMETMGSIATIVRRDGLWQGASDTRQRGTGAVGF